MPAAGSCALLSALKRRRFGRRRRPVYAEPVDGTALRAVDVAAMGRVHGSVAYVARRRRGGYGGRCLRPSVAPGVGMPFPDAVVGSRGRTAGPGIGRDEASVWGCAA